MNVELRLLASLAWTLALVLLQPGSVWAQPKAPTLRSDSACRDCHDDMAKIVVAHKNCTGCHTTVNPQVIPHNPDGKKARQIVASGPEMCLA